MKNEQNNFTPPKEDIKDHLYSLTKAGFISIPVIGPAIGELFKKLILPPVEKRTNEWKNMVGETLSELLNKKLIDIDSLVKSDEFNTLLIQASMIAIRTHENYKLKALRNAVANTALSLSCDASKKQLFLQLVDQFTALHIKILQFFSFPDKWVRRHRSDTLREILKNAFPELQNEPDLFDLLIFQLYSNALTKTYPIHNVIPGTNKETTALADEFLEYIRSPKDPTQSVSQE